ncbi:DUF4143 domain-containing protein [Phascolarctobacterium sp.]|uniref:DUF4143 domain-containing protein n=1 Tax=Phascolarctobacterium sp. TaxID=2049039 RepID=UPI0026DD66C9|nr:DUF4143 domain-containing protein [Phascolarctobacterium sp.]
MTDLQNAIRNLQLNNKLVILRTCGNDRQKELLVALAKDYTTVDMSLPNLRLQVEQNPRLFLSSLRLPVYLANLQYTPSLLPALLSGGVPLAKVLVSCSQSYYLEALAGQQETRKVVFGDLPLPQADELNEPFAPTAACLANLRQKQQEVFTAVLWGTWDGCSEELGAYISGLVQREIMEQTTVSDAMKFYRFLCVAASMTGTVVNYSRLCSGVGITAPTAKQWLQFLAGTGMVYLLQPLGSLGSKRMVKAPKLYFRDTGAAAQLLQIGDVKTLVQSFYLKNLFDNYVLNRLRESYLRQGKRARMMFYQDSNYKEISLILRVDGVLYPVNICKDGYSVRKVQKSFELLRGYAAEHGAALGSGCVIGTGGEIKLLADNLYYLPAEYV